MISFDRENKTRVAKKGNRSKGKIREKTEITKTEADTILTKKVTTQEMVLRKDW